MANDKWERYEDLCLAAKNVEEKGLVADVLCARCTRGTVFRRRSKLDVMAFCSVIASYVPNDIAECGSFVNAKAMDLEDMNRLAVIVDKREAISDGSYI